MSWWTSTENGLRLRIRVAPRASRTEVAGLHGDALKIRLHAPPVDGAANTALIAFLAKTADLPKSAFTITRGHASRDKEVAVRCAEPATAAARLWPV
ncbi:MAG TPA: DUF167 family protein [Kiritimatiellia bacterium]|nr:DUF167 family protein [Kiritimatiellia bacterium]